AEAAPADAPPADPRVPAAPEATAASPSTGLGPDRTAASASAGGPAVPGPREPVVQRAGVAGKVSPRVLAAAAVVVVLAVLGAVLFFTLGDDDPAGGTSNDKAASSGASGGQGDDKGTDAKPSGDASDDSGKDGSGKDGSGQEESGKGDDRGAGGTEDGKGGDEPSAKPSKPSADGGQGRGAPVVDTHDDRQGFSIGLPAGWKYTSTGATGARFSGPDGQRLLVAYTSTPKPDPVADWRNQETVIRGRYQQYERIRIEAVDFRGWKTADWEFTFVSGGVKYRSVDRGFIVNSRQAYALFYTAKADGWDGDQRRDTWETFTRTFTPKS
ncbi:serine/threonine protein kinase, partial [Streptomyces sp. NPDC060194]